MDTITLPASNQLCVVIGGRLASGRLLEMAAHLALRGPLLLLDCGNRANPLPVVRALRRLTHDPLQALEHIQAARAFTCYQVAALFEQVSRRPGPQPILIFDLLATFYDESVSYADGRRLLEHSLGCIDRLRQSAPVLVSARPPLADFPERSTFLDLLCHLSDRYWIEEIPAASTPRQGALFELL